MEHILAKMILTHLEAQPFPHQELPILRELILRCGTKDIVYLCAICYLFGRATIGEEPSTLSPL